MKLRDPLLLLSALLFSCLVPIVSANSDVISEPVMSGSAVPAPQQKQITYTVIPTTRVTNIRVAHIPDIEMIPWSTQKHPGERKGTVHTLYRIMVRPSNLLPRSFSQAFKPSTTGLPPQPGESYNTPASLACIYGLTSNTGTNGCNPNNTTLYNTGGSGTIAIVDAYDDPTAASDLAAFSAQFGLPAANFSVVYASGTKPGTDPTGSWEGEESLDIEYAHAMAPNAKIVLVETATNNWSDLLVGISRASSIVAAGGGGEVSMSFAGAEFSGETSYDSYFTTTNVVYIAGAGDSGGVYYPSTSPNVISAGGTTILTNGSGAYTGQMAWADTGGGPSTIEPMPTYQNNTNGLGGSFRGTPDIAFEADPNSGVWVYDSTPIPGISFTGGWLVVGGTSLSSPALAGIINTAGNFASTSAALTKIYAATSNLKFAYITVGTCGASGDRYSTNSGWSYCSGNGIPSGITQKPSTGGGSSGGTVGALDSALGGALNNCSLHMTAILCTAP